MSQERGGRQEAATEHTYFVAARAAAAGVALAAAAAAELVRTVATSCVRPSPSDVAAATVVSRGRVVVIVVYRSERVARRSGPDDTGDTKRETANGRET